MKIHEQTRFDAIYTNYLRDLKLQGKADKTIDAYSRASHPGTIMDKGGVQKAIKLIAKQVGISKNIHIHTLRHSIATHMLERGMSLRAIQTFLGHASPDTTAKYTRMTQEIKQCSALMLNDLVDNLAIVWQEVDDEHA